MSLQSGKLRGKCMKCWMWYKAMENFQFNFSVAFLYGTLLKLQDNSRFSRIAFGALLVCLSRVEMTSLQRSISRRFTNLIGAVVLTESQVDSDKFVCLSLWIFWLTPHWKESYYRCCLLFIPVLPSLKLCCAFFRNPSHDGALHSFEESALLGFLLQPMPERLGGRWSVRDISTSFGYVDSTVSTNHIKVPWVRWKAPTRVLHNMYFLHSLFEHPTWSSFSDVTRALITVGRLS